MPDAVSLIDLDVTPPSDPVRRGRPRLRPWLVAGVLIASLGTLGPAAPPLPGMRAVLEIDGAAVTGFTVGPDALYTSSFRSRSGRTEISRYPLPGSGVEWSTALPELVSDLLLDPAAGVLTARDNAGQQLTFLDPADGRILWRHRMADAGVAVTTAGGVLLPAAADGALTFVDLRTGEPIWRRVLTRGSDVRTDEAAGRVVVVELSGRVTTLRLADGSVLGQGDLGVRIPPDFVDAKVTVDVVGDRIVVTDRTTRVRTAYLLPAVTRDWQVRDATPGYLQDCRPVYCLSGPNDGVAEVTGIDPADGSVRWTAPGWDFARLTERGRTLVQAGREIPEIAEIDPRDGTVLRDKVRGFPVGEVAIRPDTELLGQAWVMIPDPRGTGRRALGPYGVGAFQTCDMNAPYLVCALTSGPLTVWRLPVDRS